MKNSGASDPIVWIPKGWGGEKVIVNSDEYCGKILFFIKDRKCSWHFHLRKDETFYVRSGAIELLYGYDDQIEFADVVVLGEGDKFHLPRTMRHQMFALADTELFEFSTKHYDEDSYRLRKGD